MCSQHCEAGMCVPGAAAACGDGGVACNEACDDGNLSANDGCSPTCTLEGGWTCGGEPSSCEPVCGDGQRRGNEGCDDSNHDTHDACPSSPTGPCQPARCGDGFIWSLEGGSETCDDGNLSANDGCSPTCTLEGGWTCGGEPSSCEPVCGDGQRRGNEGCDDGNHDTHDACPSSPTGPCQPARCGDGFIWSLEGGSETCDDGNDGGGDGCNSACSPEDHWHCVGEPSACACAAGYQDNDHNGTCLPTCAAVPCVYGTCSDLDGQARCICFPDIPYLRGAACDECVVYAAVGGAAAAPDGRAWATAFAALQPAVNAAGVAVTNGVSRGCEVWVAKGTYHVYTNGAGNSVQLRPHVAVYGGFAGVETSRAERDWAANPTILDGSREGAPDSRVYHVVRGADSARLDGFHVRRGHARGLEADAYGGGVLVHGSSGMVLENCVVSDNVAAYGGGMANRRFENVAVRNSLFTGNVGHQGGGALYNEEGSLSVQASVFAGNMNTGIVNSCTTPTASCGKTRFESSVFVAEEGAYGGAISSADHDVELFGITCVANRAPWAGGCVYLAGKYASLLMVNSIEWNNPALALYAGPGLTMTVRYSDTHGSLLGGAGNLSTDPKFRAFANAGNQYWSSVTFLPEVNQTVLTDSGALWKPGGLAGLYVQPDVASTNGSQAFRRFPILKNGATSMTVWGDLTTWYDGTAFVESGDQYQIADYHLDSSSPCIDKGTSHEPPGADLDGRVRVCRDTGLPGCPDMGAWEYR